MDKHNERFIPETVDERVDELLQSQNAPLAEVQIVQELYRISTEDAGSLEHVWNRLGLDTHMSFTDAVRQANPLHEPIIDQARMITHERKHNMLLNSNNDVPKRQSGRIFALIAAVIVAALLVGSALLVFNQATHFNQSPTSSNTTHEPQISHQQEVKTPSGVYVGGDNGIARIDVQTGKQIWKYSYPTTASSGLLYSVKIIPIGDMIYVGMQSFSVSAKPAVLAIDVLTGKLRWSHTFDDANLNDLTATGDMLYAGTTNNSKPIVSKKDPKQLPAPSTSTSSIYVFKAADGAQQATYQLSGDLQTLSIADNVLYVGASNGLHALRISNGKQLWYTAINGQNVSITTPHIVSGVLYTGITSVSEQGNQSTGVVAAFKTRTGERLWQSDAIQSQLFAITVANNKVFVGTMASTAQGPFKGGVRAYDAQNGKLAWSIWLNGAVEWAPAVDKNQVYVSVYPALNQQEEVVALNIANGSIKWTAHIPAGVLTAPMVVNGVVYASTDNAGSNASSSTITAFKASDGSLNWTSSSSNITSAEALVVVG